MQQFETSPNFRKFFEGVRPNECITLFKPTEQKFIFSQGIESVLELSLDELNQSNFAKPFELIKTDNSIVPNSDREIVGILHIAIYSAFFEYKDVFRPLKDYLFCSFRMINKEHEIFRIEKETHSFYDPRTKELLLVDMWRRLDFKNSNKKVEWGPVVSLDKKDKLISTIKTHIYRNLGIPPLTIREEEIVKLIRTGIPLKTIGERLFIERNTVKKHLENVKKKLSSKFDKKELSTKAQICDKLQTHGILDL